MIKKTQGYELKKQKFEIKHASNEINPSLEQKTSKPVEKQLTQRQIKKPADKTKNETQNVVSPNQPDIQTSISQAAGLATNPNPTAYLGAAPTLPRLAPANVAQPQKTSSTTTQGQKKVNVTKVQAPTKRLIPIDLAITAVQKFIQLANTKITTTRQLNIKSQNAENRLERGLAESDLKEERKLTKKEAEQEKKAVEHETQLHKSATTKPIGNRVKPTPSNEREIEAEPSAERPSLKR